MGDRKLLKVMELAIKFIEKANDKQLESLISGDLSLTFKENKKRCKINKKELNREEKEQIIDAAYVIKGFKDRNDALKYLENLKFTKDKLIKLGNELGLRIPKRNTKSRIIEIVIEDIVGTKLKRESLRKGIMGNDYKDK